VIGNSIVLLSKMGGFIVGGGLLNMKKEKRIGVIRGS